MALHDSIILEIENGLLDKQLRATDLLGEERKVTRIVDGKGVERYRVGFDFYSENHIRSEMPNNAEVSGYWVKAGQVAKYRRLEEGLYRVVAFDEQDELLDIHEAAATDSLVDGVISMTPEQRLACYLELEPFQIFDRKRKTLYPLQPVIGFSARISAYFWPVQTVGFVSTERVLQGFVARARDLKSDLQERADDVLALFADICKWGGVRLPTNDAQVVVDNLCLAAHRSRKHPAAMNSAWTKLYAFFYPEDFLIYDSRVATALVSMAESVMEDSELEVFKAAYPGLGVIPGRGGSRPRVSRSRWKNAYTSWTAQLDANALAQAVLAVLNQKENAHYSLRQLEAVLFMEGY